MATAQIPKYNESLKSFSTFIDAATIAGAIGTVIGFIVVFSNPLIGLAILYLGTLALSLSLIARFLRKTATIIVEGLGGTIDIDYTPTLKVFNISEFRLSAAEGWSEAELSDLLPKNLYDAWIKNHKPSLKSFADSKEDSFFDWLVSQKSN